ncbi:unnamed protein product [Macrosiphum euphorbiae]|uniref:Nudix hydrolase domain-containing protein n=1 Tax=Macrosiphum euphorbiae TaxID=13131 RepID=A0AAV0XM06_9HEMI|nr:unnamed protein product [Macrosiphum euphorbiae]
MKDKPNSTRIYDEDGFRRRAACICVRNDSDEVLTSATALREVVEEAGVVGRLHRRLGTFEDRTHIRRHRTDVFVMIVTEELAEWEDSLGIGRKRKWFKLEDALNMLRLHKPTQHTYLESFALNKQKANI